LLFFSFSIIIWSTLRLKMSRACCLPMAVVTPVNLAMVW
jgi:hypothetical protein